MTIHELKIYGFGKHCNLEISFYDGTNIILGRNESGKSTVASFIRALLYGMPENNTSRERKKFHPGNRDVKYGGEMTFEHMGVLYKVTSEFGESKINDVTILYNVTANEKISLGEGMTVGETVLKITADTYDMVSYAAQLSSKPNTDNAEADYLFDRLMKNTVDSKNSATDILACKRLKAAKNFVRSSQAENGILDLLQKKKEKTEAAILKVDSVIQEAEQKRNECSKMQQALNEEKDKHISIQSDMNEVAKAVEIVSLHADVKKYVKEINLLDDELANAAKRTKRIRTPVNIIFGVLISIIAICVLVLIFTPQINKLSFMANLCKYLNIWSQNQYIYMLLGAGAILLILFKIIFSTIYNRKVRLLRDELFTIEEALSELLKIEYIYSAKKHSTNRENINIALDNHKSEYKRARMVLENEDNKTKTYNEHLAVVENYTEKMAYTKASADALTKSVSEMEDSYFLKEELSEINTQIELFERRYEALSLAEEIMEEAYQRWQSETGPEFSKDAADILEKMTNGRYKEMKISRNFDISLKNDAGAMQRAYNYSGATVDQMYLALRLALVKSLSSKDERLPVILDDPFVQYDSERKQLAYRAVDEFSKENNIQIILTACLKEPFYNGASIIEL
ncbi:MAG: AAA family ATPase [Clostridia bacterium]|nr:AAA family ATPase [Clostridia bacterium]